MKIDESVAKLKEMHLVMLRIRKFEEKVAGILSSGTDIVCPVHLSVGQEGVAAGVCAGLGPGDFVFSTHRCHAHYIAKGGDINTLMAELYGRATGCSRGRGGSMHLAAPEIGFPGSSAIVAGTIPLAVGAAMGFALQGKDNVAVAFFGDGATNEGVFYEALNLAALKRLPVIFVCENNLYATHMPVSACLADTDIYKKAGVFNLPGERVDGNDALAVYEAAGRKIEAARRGQGPALIECMTYRWLGHVGPSLDIDKGLRSKTEIDRWMERCPIKTAERQLVGEGLLSDSEKAGIYAAVDKEIEAALGFALKSPLPDRSELLDNIYKNQV